MLKRKPKILTPEQAEEIRTKDFFDMILPGTVKFLSDHYIVGDSYRCVWAIREYPPSTEEQAILSQLADRNGVTLRIYHRLVESMEQRKIIQNATRRNRLKSGGNDVNETIEAEGNLQDVIELLANLRKNKEPLLHVSVFIELKARSMEKLKELQSDIAMELTRSKISVDRLTLRQKEGFLSVIPTGCNQFGAQYERVLPASSVANMYPFNFSGKTDPHGSYIGRDKYGTNILVDFDRRAEDKTNSNALILGNSGQGKSYLLKLILTNIRESGKRIICLDPESEYEDLCDALGGCYIDFMSGEYTINPLEPKAWTDSVEDTETLPFRKMKNDGRLPQYYVENSNPAIVSRETFQAAQNLLRSRKTERCKRKSYPLTGKLRCPECGRVFRHQVVNGKAHWICSCRSSGATDCQHRHVREDIVYDIFTDMVIKLKTYRAELLGTLIHQMETMQDRTSRNQERIRQIAKEIADLGAKNHIIARLHTSGAMNAADYAMQTSEIGNRLTELRIERRQKLTEDEDDQLLATLKDLNGILDEYEPTVEFDNGLFDEIVESIMVDSSEQLTFKLIGGITLTEQIPKKGR